MSTLFTFPRGFVPEEYGWQVANPIIPRQQHEVAMFELHQFGFVSTHFLRWHIPFREPFLLVVAGYHSATDRYWGMYERPFEWGGGRVTVARVNHEIMHGPGSPERPFVSRP